MLKENLRDCYKQIQATKNENVGLQVEIQGKDKHIEKCENTINHLRELYVAHAKIPGLDNLGMIVVRKYTSKDNGKHFNYPYYIVCIQRHAITTSRQWFQETFLESKEIMMIVNPNRVHTFNRFEEEDHVESYKCHFRLNDLTRDVCMMWPPQSLKSKDVKKII